jgi:tripartite-type tricarboxylate transporter receptor subunit TctC
MIFDRVTGCLIGLLVLGVPAHAQDQVADFYKGKQVKIIVASGPGGGYDLYARYLARHFSRHIPGNPGVIVQNMPGAGGIT